MSKDTTSAYYLHVLSMALVLSLLGMALLSWLHCLGLDQKIYQKSPLAIELKPNYKTDSLDLLKKFLSGKIEIEKSSIEFISKENALAEMKNELPSTNQGNQENPFLDLLMFRFSEKMKDNNFPQKLAEDFTKWTIIESFHFENNWSSDMNGSIKGLKRTSLLASILLALMSLAIIWHLVKVYVKEKKPIIETLMNLGASKETILRPYFKLSLIHGLSSASLAMVFIGVAIFMLNSLAPWIYELIELKKFFVVILVLLFLGPFIHWQMVKKHVLNIINDN